MVLVILDLRDRTWGANSGKFQGQRGHMGDVSARWAPPPNLSQDVDLAFSQIIFSLRAEEVGAGPIDARSGAEVRGSPGDSTRVGLHGTWLGHVITVTDGDVGREGERCCVGTHGLL